MKFKFLFLLNLLLSAYFVRADNQSLTLDSDSNVKSESGITKIIVPVIPAVKVKELREAFKPLLEIPSKFLKFRSLWYEGNHRQQMKNILMKEKIKRTDLQALIDLLNKEEKLLSYKAGLIADAINAVILKKFYKELSHLLPNHVIDREARAKFIRPAQLVNDEKLRHKKIIQEQIVPLVKSLPSAV